ncbi:MAG: hypothetical protein D6793_07270, partial [Thermoflexia bacterium]
MSSICRRFLPCLLLTALLQVWMAGVRFPLPAGARPSLSLPCDLRPATCDGRPSPLLPLDPALARVLAHAGPDDVIPAIVILREQADLTPPPAPSPLLTFGQERGGGAAEGGGGGVRTVR